MKRELGSRHPIQHQPGEEPSHHPLLIHHNPIARWFYLTVGTISLGLGIIGIVTPVLPTTPFLLLTAACYARGSRRFYIWLMNHRWFGPYIYKWRIEKKIPLRIKMYAISMIILTIGSTVLFFMPPILPAQLLVTAIGVGVIIYIARFPSK